MDTTKSAKNLITAPDRFCEQVMPNGRRCRVRRTRGSSYCFFHAPERRADRTAARRAGGLKKRMASLPEVTPDAPLASARDVGRLLAQTINQVRRGELNPKVANAVGYLAGIGSPPLKLAPRALDYHIASPWNRAGAFICRLMHLGLRQGRISTFVSLGARLCASKNWLVMGFEHAPLISLTESEIYWSASLQLRPRRKLGERLRSLSSAPIPRCSDHCFVTSVRVA